MAFRLHNRFEKNGRGGSSSSLLIGPDENGRDNSDENSESGGIAQIAWSILQFVLGAAILGIVIAILVHVQGDNDACCLQVESTLSSVATLSSQAPPWYQPPHNCPDCDCPDPCPGCDFVHTPQIECNFYNSMAPPPGWPEFAAPWALQGQYENVCNLTPPLININATEAMRAYETQSLDDNIARVIFIDVRDPDEFYWIGAPAQMNSMTLNNGTVLVPDLFITTLHTDSTGTQEHHFEIDGNPVVIPVSAVASTARSAVSFNVPVELVDGKTGLKTLNPLWGLQVDAIIRDTGADRVIFYCRSGQRSSIGCYYEYCPFQVLFPGIFGGLIKAYEVESLTENGRGGFQGTDYSGSYGGYRGFPDRDTSFQTIQSAAFQDAGLPMVTSSPGPTVEVQPASNPVVTLSLDTIEVAPWADQIMAPKHTAFKQIGAFNQQASKRSAYAA